MKKYLLFLIALLISCISIAQYNQIGQQINGAFSNEFLGTSLSMNAQGNRMAVFSAFAEGSDSSGQVKVFEFINGVWELLGEPVIGLPSLDQQGAGVVELNNLGNRFVFSSPLHNGNNIEASGVTRVF
ncbi:MAG: hypothetical protein ACSHW7_04660 [Patiriisocius sp.]|uniref:hypothetical protein n=1 Tax=Patiriisocius sp. TaxID=2822396 RepID=UPI003EF4489B